MKTTLRAALVLGLLGVLAGPAPGQGDGKKDMAAVEAVMFVNLKDVINKGVDLYNGGDIPGCYRLFEGTLRTLRPLVEHRPALVKEIDDKLAAAEKEGVAWRRAFALRAALDKVRSDIRPKDAVAPPVVKPEDDEALKKLLKSADDKKKLDEDLKKKDDEIQKRLDEEARKKAAADKKKLDDEELKKKIDDEAKKAEDEKRKKTEDDKKKKDDEKPGETKDDKDAPPVLRKPKELKDDK